MPLLPYLKISSLQGKLTGPCEPCAIFRSLMILQDLRGCCQKTRNGELVYEIRVDGTRTFGDAGPSSPVNGYTLHATKNMTAVSILSLIVIWDPRLLPDRLGSTYISLLGQQSVGMAGLRTSKWDA
jgi:hypothetical protein